MIEEAEALLRRGVSQMLMECLGDNSEKVKVVYHLCATSRLEPQERHEELEPDEVAFVETVIWRLNLYFTVGNRTISLNGWLPYHYCMDGDVLPMRTLVKALWDQFRFTYLMIGDPSTSDQSIETVLREVAEEAERGT